MTCTDTHPHRSDLRRRAERLIAALDAAPAPQTLPDIMRAARTLMVIDRLLGQLWTAASTKPGRQPAPLAVPEVPPEDTAATAPLAMPLNRHQRRQQAARDRNARPDDDPFPRRETG